MASFFKAILYMAAISALLLGTACKNKRHETWEHGSYGSGKVAVGKNGGKFGACVPEDLANVSCK
jgi:hypothetical protein